MKKTLFLTFIVLLLFLNGCDGGGCPADSNDPAIQSVTFSYDENCKLDESHYLSVKVDDVKTNTHDCNWDKGSVIVVSGTYTLTQEPGERNFDSLRIIATFGITGAEISENIIDSCSEPLETGTGTWVGMSELKDLEPGGHKSGINLEMEGLRLSTVCHIETCVGP
ncbi:MAG: hypothetical protein PHE84_00285 [bacterium]|nr:hypothetical protein [bacterium]